jgi:hypothetical protein
LELVIDFLFTPSIEFEKHRTKKRGCNKCVYCWVGFVNCLCACRGPPSIFEHIEYLRTKKGEDVQNKILSVIKEAEIEETGHTVHDNLMSELKRINTD